MEGCSDSRPANSTLRLFQLCLRVVPSLWGRIRGLHPAADSPSTPQEGAPAAAAEPQPQDAEPGRSPAHCCFSREELQQILQERNELKTNLFLVQEELAYYQR